MATGPHLSAKRVVVGGGIAGLSAAYELIKAGCDDVTLLESSLYLGGVVRSATINTAQGIGVDFGASDISVNDINVLTICDELQIRSLLHTSVKPKIITPEICNINEYGAIEPWQDIFTHHQFGAFMGKILEVGLLTSGESLSYYYPNQVKFGNTTLAEFLEGFPELKDVVSRSFLALGFGSADEMPLFLGLPLLTRSAESLSFSGRTHILVDTLATYVQKHGCLLRTGCKVVGVQTNDKHVTTLEVKNATSGKSERVVCDQLVFACPIDRIPNNVGVALQLSKFVHNRSVTPEYRYTDSMVVLVHVNDVPLFGTYEDESREWHACFQTAYTSDVHDKVQLVRVENCTPSLDDCHLSKNDCARSSAQGEVPKWLKLYFDMRDFTWIKMLRQHSKQSIQAVSKIVQTTFCEVPLFKANNTEVIRMLHYEVIQRRHPILNGAAVYEMHKSDGVNNIWFAGQHMGTTGSLETACFSGRRAAHALLGSTQLAHFDAHMRRSEQHRINQFRWKALGAYGVAATGLAVGVACALIGTKLLVSHAPAKKQESAASSPHKEHAQPAFHKEPPTPAVYDAVVEHAASTSSILEEFRKQQFYKLKK
jgi:hypothetical protein